MGKGVHQILILFFWCVAFGRLVLLLRCQEEAERSFLCVNAKIALQTTLLEIPRLYTIYIQLRRYIFGVRCVNFKLCHRLQRQVPNEQSCCRTALSVTPGADTPIQHSKELELCRAALLGVRGFCRRRGCPQLSPSEAPRPAPRRAPPAPPHPSAAGRRSPRSHRARERLRPR